MRRKKMKDTDYLFLSAKLRAMENNLLTAGRMERMIDAPTAAEAARVLSEIGYGEFSPDSESTLSEALAAEREKTFEELRHFMPDHSVIDVFRVKYDYHNLKAVLKAQAMGLPCEGLLIDAGRVDPKALLEALREGDYAGLPEELAAAAQEAAEVLGTTKDPQRSDFVLDRAYYREMLRCAKETGSEFLHRYVQMTIDMANLRSAVRTLRMGKGGDFLRRVLVDGGTIPAERVTAAALGSGLGELYRTTELRAAAEYGTAAIQGGSLTDFEKACDDAMTRFVAKAKQVPFGVEVAIGYLAAKEIEFTAVRMIMSSRMAGIDGEIIRERLRESYV